MEAGAAARGTAFRVYLALYGALRFMLDPLRGDGRPERFLGISHQQGIALCVIALALVWQRTMGSPFATAIASAPKRAGGAAPPGQSSSRG